MARSPTRSDIGVTRVVHRIFLGIAILFCVILLILWRSESPRLDRARMTLADKATPSMNWVNEPLAFIWHIVRDWKDFTQVYQQNKRLRREIQSLRAYRENARILEEENAELRALNHVRLATRTTFVTGDVIADSGGPFLQSALVNVGREDGIMNGAAAVDGSGLVGRVVGVGERASRLLLLTDYSSRVPVIVKPGARKAVLVGDGTSAPRLAFLDGREKVHPGDRVETSGDGGVFPPDLPVGRVIIPPGGTVRAQLLADYARLEFVRLLRYQPDTRIDAPGGLVKPGGVPSAAAKGQVAETRKE